MSGILNRPAYERMIEEDVHDVEKHIPPSIFRDYIVLVLRDSVRLQYDEIPAPARRWVDTYGPDRA
jgi:hypothetical protein